ncbi:IclR family transcriptional regulator, partial [Lactiplantibacillus plantarum]
APHWRVAELGVMMAGDPHAEAVRGLRPVLRQISDVSGDSAFLICRAGGDSLCLHREVGNYPVQVLAVTIGHRQPLGVGAAGLALLGA